jgi:hypothetical protein
MTITSRSLVTGRPVLSCVGFGRATLEHRAGPLYGLLDGTGLEHPSGKEDDGFVDRAALAPRNGFASWSWTRCHVLLHNHDYLR